MPPSNEFIKKILTGCRQDFLTAEKKNPKINLHFY
jgi:hypothetical protein